MSSPEVCVLKTDGVNCDEEMIHAFEVAGGSPELVHINQLRSGTRRLTDYGILALAGGFSHGDDIASGKVLATELTSYLSEQVQEFIDADKPVFGVCNGFQVLVRTGLLPSASLGEQQITLDRNDSGRFECRWVDLSVEDNASRFVQPDDFEKQPISMQIAHGEGKLVAPGHIVRDLSLNRQVVFRYGDPDSTLPLEYPQNPNGSLDNIAGITDQTGLILGMMPHPERSIEASHPDRDQTEASRGAGKVIFDNIVAYAQEL